MQGHKNIPPLSATAIARLERALARILGERYPETQWAPKREPGEEPKT